MENGPKIHTVHSYSDLQVQVKMACKVGTADQFKAKVLWKSILCADPRNPSAIRMVLRRVGCSGSCQKTDLASELSQKALPSHNAVQQKEAITKPIQGPKFTQVYQSGAIPTLHSYSGLQVQVKASQNAETADQCKAKVLWKSVLCADPRNPSAIRMILRRIGCSGSCQKTDMASELIQQALPSQNAVQQKEAITKPCQVSSFLSWKRMRDSLDQELKQSNHKRPKLVVKGPSSTLPQKQQQQRNKPTGTSIQASGSRGRKRAASQDE